MRQLCSRAIRVPTAAGLLVAVGLLAALLGGCGGGGGGGAPVITITAQPTAQTAFDGAASFAVTASATRGAVLAYQWQKLEAGEALWADVPAATAPTLALTGLLHANDDGDAYRVEVSAPGAAPVTSDEVALTIPWVTITTQPTAQTAFDGAATLAVEAGVTPSAALAYQWQRLDAGAMDWVDVADATGASLALTGLVHASDHGDSYRVVVASSGAASVMSDEVALTIPLVTITAQPTAQTAFDGAASFSVTATVAPAATLGYQWQKQEAGGTTWTDLAGKTATSLALTGLTYGADHGDRYRVLVSSPGAATVASSDVALTIPLISITTQPAAQTSVSGAATFSVTASVSPTATLSYQWQRRESGGSTWNNVTGGTGSSLSLSGLIFATDNGDTYRVVVTSAGAAPLTSTTAGLTVAFTAWVQVGLDIDGVGGSAVSASSDGMAVAIGYVGGARVYDWNGSAWVQRGSTIVAEESSDNCGHALALSDDGNTLALSAPSNSLNPNQPTGIGRGHVRVFDWNGSAWAQRGGDIDGESYGDNSGFGLGMSADGNVVAIGAPYNDGGTTLVDCGHVRVYYWNSSASAWTQRGVDIDGEGNDDWSGWGVALNAAGDVLAIGAPGNDGAGKSRCGHTRVYAWNGTAWVRRGIDIDGEAADDASGKVVCLDASGDVLSIAAQGNDGSADVSGHVRVYYWTGTSWLQRGIDIDGESKDDASGWSMSMSDDGSVIAISARLNNNGLNTDAGHVRVYVWSGTDWYQRGVDLDGEAAGDESGFAVSLSSDGSMLAISARYNAGTGGVMGHVRVRQAQ